MAGIEIGRICLKTRGREAGKQAVIVSIDEKTGFAIIDGTDIKRKQCNLRHLFPTNKKLDIKKDAKHDEIIKLMK
ncbi:MAG: KOW motif-containing protein [Candidatus Diapherotrites archaeon]